MSVEAAVVLVMTGGSLILYGLTVRSRRRAARHDGGHAADELEAAIALFLTALLATSSVLVGALVSRDSAIRAPLLGFLFYGFLAAFLASAWLVYDAWGRRP